MTDLTAHLLAVCGRLQRWQMEDDTVYTKDDGSFDEDAFLSDRDIAFDNFIGAHLTDEIEWVEKSPFDHDEPGTSIFDEEPANAT